MSAETLTAEKLSAYFNQLVTKTETWHTKFPTEFGDLRHLQKIFQEKLNRFSKEEDILNIAIMGQVKAGKSSFLNALLFNGKPILPEAATPKTANLTRISYAEKPRLEVEFFSETDWKLVQNLANSDSNDNDTKMAKEQVAMIQQAGIDPIATIQKGTHIQETQNLDDIMAVLNDYAGNDGKYTALVKMIRLYLPLPELQGYNIIDTPGMNDPVISRTQRTKEEMANSDVVFFLSRASNFLDSSDVNLITSQLPEAGVKRLVIMAGQYDSAINQDGYDRDSLAITEANIQKRQLEHSNKILAQMIEKKRKIGQDKIADLLDGIDEPIFSSTYAYGYANWSQDRWNEGMKHSYSELVDIADEQWNGYQFSKADWERIAGFDKLQSAYEQARKDKIVIIEQQKLGLLPEAITNLKTWQNQFKEQIEQRIVSLQDSDISQLNQKQAMYEAKIQAVVDSLGSVLEKTINDVEKTKQNTTENLANRLEDASDLQTYTGTEQVEKRRTIESDGKKFFRTISFGLYDGREYETYYKTVEYEYASVSDAVDNLTSYTHRAKSDIERAFDRLVNPKTIKIDLKKALMNVLDTSDTSFDAVQFRNIIEQSIARIELPKLELSLGDVSSMISDRFSSSHVRDTYQLKRTLESSLEYIHDKLNHEFVYQVNNVIDTLQNIQNNLANNLTKNIQDELDQLRKDLQERENTINSYQQLLANLK